MNTDIQWDDVFRIVKNIVKEIEESGKRYDYIMTIPKGGLMPSYFFAEALGLPVETVTVQSYVGKDRGELVLQEQQGFSKEVLPGDRVLVIDDIYDSGATINYIQKKYPNIDTVCLYARHPDHSLTFVGAVLNHNEYIDFPWENKIK